MSYLGRSAKLSLKAQEKVSFLATAGQTVKTGLSYTPSFIEVYVNGVLLTDTTDFTATNGNSVTFTVALLLNDEVTVISLKTFTVADHYSKTEADTLLAAKSPIASPVFTGNVLVGTTSTGLNTSSSLEGHNLFPSGYTVHARSGQTVMSLNRLSTDGIIQDFRKGGTVVGSIGTKSGAVYIGTGDAGIAFNHHGGGDLDSMMPYSVTAGAFQNGAVDIGGSVNRFKDAYLSGGVYLGGTGAANKLDEYEEGSVTPVVKYGTTTMSLHGNGLARYVKIGSSVTYLFEFRISNTNNGGGDFTLALPFAMMDGGYAVGGLRIYAGAVAGGEFLGLHQNESTLKFNRNRNNTSVTSIIPTLNAYYYGSITYRTS